MLAPLASYLDHNADQSLSMMKDFKWDLSSFSTEMNEQNLPQAIEVDIKSQTQFGLQPAVNSALFQTVTTENSWFFTRGRIDSALQKLAPDLKLSTTRVPYTSFPEDALGGVQVVIAKLRIPMAALAQLKTALDEWKAEETRSLPPLNANS